MTRRRWKHMALIGFAILAAVLFGASRDGIDQLLRDWTRPGGQAGSEVVPVADTEITGTATVIDGDTLEIHGQRIRLHGIDAPESGQSCKNSDGQAYRCGQQAALALSDRIGRSPVTCVRRDTDRYGRIIAVCHQGALDLNLWMVANGHALAYRRYSTDYVPQEELAKHHKRGMWAGDFEAPWDWRKKKPAPVGATSEPPATGCTIKGNINRSGDRIYHLPGQHHYERTRVSENKGEQWFCSESEARAAGWRRSKR